MLRQDEHGLTLIEVITALSILSILFMAMLPIYTFLISEQHDMEIEKRALALLDRESIKYATGEDVSIGGSFTGIRKDIPYEINSREKQEGAMVCIDWKQPSGDKEEKCLYVEME
ncbi:type II secretion system protein [Alteribacillus sp. HJP-4]|uniref:type II secretion system protein n=1 Tax=Alteribacillus sp. HJP-4 TaxID=2775394 RepID=UPI0035CD3498